MPPPAPPPKLMLTRLDNPALSLEAQYNPDELSETYGAEWSSLKVPGFSSTRRQFSNTKDAQLKFTLRFLSQHEGAVRQKQMLPVRAFLKSCCRPVAFASSVGVAGAPLVMFTWPNMFSMIVTIDSLDFKYARQDAHNRVKDMSVGITCTEFADALVTADDFEEGTDYT